MISSRSTRASQSELGTARSASIARVGARCPLGLNSLQTTTAARAGKLEIRESSLVDKHERSVGLVYARFLPEDLFGLERLVRLGAPALSEAAAGLLMRVPLLVGVGEPARPDLMQLTDTELISRLAQASEVAIDEAQSRVIRAGNASFAWALEAARELFELGAPAALVGCVDSYMHPEAITWLDSTYRLHAEETEDGIVPSEAAAFALVLPSAHVDARLFQAPAPTPLALIRYARAGRDESVLEPDAPVLAQVITELVQGALVSCYEQPSWLMTDVDEYHRMREWSRVELRVHPVFESVEHVRVPDLFGDTGAATGALAAAYACRGWSLGGAPRGTLILALHADGAPRGVVALEEVR